MINSSKQWGNHFYVVESAKMHWYLRKVWMFPPFFSFSLFFFFLSSYSYPSVLVKAVSAEAIFGLCKSL